MKTVQGYGYLLLCTAAAVALLPVAASAQTAANYPGKPVRVITPFLPGGSAYSTIRNISDHLGKDMGQPFVVESRPGGGTIIATRAVTQAPPDGHTLLVHSATLLANHWTQPNLPYDTLKDLVGVSTLARNDHLLAAHPSVPANTLKELIAYMKKNPGKVNAYTAGLGSNNHLNNLVLMQITDTKFTVVPYKGAGVAMTDLLAGTLQIALNTPNQFAAPIKAGKLKGIAMSGDSRHPLLPDVPTFAEAGLKDFIAGTWYMLLAPGATPRGVVDKLNSGVAKAQASKEVQDFLAKAGITPFPGSVAAANALLRYEFDHLGKVIKDNDIKAAAED